MYRKNLFSKHVGEPKQKNTLLLFMEGYTKVQVDFDQERIQMVWSEDNSLLRPKPVTKLQAVCLMEKRNSEIWGLLLTLSW